MNISTTVVLILLGVISQNDGSCVNILDKHEQACAEPLRLDGSAVYDLYRRNPDHPKFGNYLKCVWTKWNWMDTDGNILFDNIKQSNSLPWRISRMCNDIAQTINLRREDFKKSASYCEQNRPANLNPLTVRKCIAENFIPTPFNFN